MYNLNVISEIKKVEHKSIIPHILSAILTSIVDSKYQNCQIKIMDEKTLDDRKIDIFIEIICNNNNGMKKREIGFVEIGNDEYRLIGQMVSILAKIIPDFIFLVILPISLYKFYENLTEKRTFQFFVCIPIIEKGNINTEQINEYTALLEKYVTSDTNSFSIIKKSYIESLKRLINSVQFVLNNSRSIKLKYLYIIMLHQFPVQ